MLSLKQRPKSYNNCENSPQNHQSVLFGWETRGLFYTLQIAGKLQVESGLKIGY